MKLRGTTRELVWSFCLYSFLKICFISCGLHMQGFVYITPMHRLKEDNDEDVDKLYG